MLDDRDKAKIRLCIRCGGPFPSACASNRFCPSCKKKKPYVDPSYQVVAFERVLNHTTSKAISESINEKSVQRQGMDDILYSEKRSSE